MKVKRNSYKAKAIDLAKKISKSKANYTCEKCYRSKSQGWQMHGAHVMPVTWASTASDPENIICLCAACHSMGGRSAHQNPHDFVRWFDDKWPGRYDILKEKAEMYAKNPFPKIDWEDDYKQLKEIAKEYDI